jgi:hypothetical protein
MPSRLTAFLPITGRDNNDRSILDRIKNRRSTAMHLKSGKPVRKRVTRAGCIVSELKGRGKDERKASTGPEQPKPRTEKRIPTIAARGKWLTAGIRDSQCRLPDGWSNLAKCDIWWITDNPVKSAFRFTSPVQELGSSNNSGQGIRRRTPAIQVDSRNHLARYPIIAKRLEEHTLPHAWLQPGQGTSIANRPYHRSGKALWGVHIA